MPVYVYVCVCYTAFSSVGGSALGCSRSVCWTVRTKKQNKESITVVNASSFICVYLHLSVRVGLRMRPSTFQSFLVFTLWFCSHHSIRVLCLHHFGVQTLCYNTFNQHFFPQSIDCASKWISLKVVLRLSTPPGPDSSWGFVSYQVEKAFTKGHGDPWMSDRKPGLNLTPGGLDLPTPAADRGEQRIENQKPYVVYWNTASSSGRRCSCWLRPPTPWRRRWQFLRWCPPRPSSLRTRSVKRCNRCVKWKETKSRDHSPLLSSYWLIWSLSPRGCPPMERNVRVCFLFWCTLIQKVTPVTFAFVRFVRVVFANVDEIVVSEPTWNSINKHLCDKRHAYLCLRLAFCNGLFD